MDNLKLQNRKGEKGFTLVELAVVMIIIGILIGGILKGQELITNARVTSTSAQMEAMGAAYNGFIDKYNAVPGDLATAAARINACAAMASCVNGNGDGNIQGVIAAAAPAAGVGAGEGTNMFGQLLAAEFITSMDGSNPAAREFGSQLPTAPIGGGFTAGHTVGGVNAAFTAAELRPGPYIVLNGSTAAVGGATGALDPQQAASIDRRIDDGAPNTGSVVGQAGNAANCRQAVAVYGFLNQTCAIAYRLR